MYILVVDLMFLLPRVLGPQPSGFSSDGGWCGESVCAGLNPRGFGLETLFWVVLVSIFLVVIVAMLGLFYVRRVSNRGGGWSGLSAERKKRMAVYRELRRSDHRSGLRKFFDDLENKLFTYKDGDMGTVSVPVCDKLVSVDVVASDTIGVGVVEDGMVRMFYKVFPGVLLLSAGVEGCEVVVRFRVLGGVSRKT